MLRFAPCRLLILITGIVWPAPGPAQVVINEVGSVQPGRLVQRPPGRPPRAGNLAAWHEPEFVVPARWQTGTGPFGFGYPVVTDVRAAMRNITPSLYLRCEFPVTAAQAASADALSLTIDYEDGLVLFLNGVEAVRRNTGAVGSHTWHDQPAFNRKPRGSAETIGLGAASSRLHAGTNVLAIQLHNNTIDDGSLYCSPALVLSGSPARTLASSGSSWRWTAGESAPSGGLYDPADFDLPGSPEFLDWIELRNPAAAAADISGWQLTDQADSPGKWTFPAGTTIPAEGYLVVAASGRDIRTPAPGGLLHTNFSLNAKGEFLALRDPAGVVQSALDGVPDQDAFHSWGLDSASGQYRFLDRGTPGAANVAGSADAVAPRVDFSKPSGFHDEPLTIELSTTQPGATIRYTLDGSEPDGDSTLYSGPFDPTSRPVTGPGAGTILREFYQWPQGQKVNPPNFNPATTPTATQLIPQFETPSGISDYYTHRVRGFLHPPQSGDYQFWLATDDDGELWLSTNDNPANKARIAYIQGNWALPREWEKHATQASRTIRLSAGRRYYVEALQSEGAGGDNCAVGWSGPGLPAGITVIEGRYLSAPDTLPPGTTTPPGHGTVRARSFLAGQLAGETATRSYVTGIDPRLKTVPAFFFSGDAPTTFYSPDGIFSQVGGAWPNGSWAAGDPRFDYNFCLVGGRPFERPAVLEIVKPGNQTVERSTVGARFAGSPWSRPQYQLGGAASGPWNSGAHSKPQMNLFFRGEFGISKLKVPGLIPTSQLDEWDTLRLRAGKNDPYNPFIIDEWMRRSFASLGAPAPQGFTATLFINGQFKSYFNPTERPRGSFFKGFYDTDNDWDINYIGSWEEGDTVAFSQMNWFFRNRDFSSTANYRQGADYWDMTNVADYVIINGWGATQDWPHNNYVYIRERAPGALWRFSMWDAEGALGRFGQSNTHNAFENELHVSSGNAIGSEGTMAALTFRRAHQNAEFRLLFADRLQKHFFNDGAMTRRNMLARWNGLRAEVEPLVAAVFHSGFDNSNWDNWANRDASFLGQARAIGLWPVTRAPTTPRYGGTMARGASVTLSNPNSGGTIHYTTDGTDPRADGGAIRGAAYSAPIPVWSPFTLKARVRSAAGEWSPLIEPAFAPAPPQLVVSELNYNPPGAGDLTEFIEITNIGSLPAPLNGAHFTDGVEFTFGDVTLPAGQCLVLVRDAAAFAAAYPGVTPGGVFTGALDNGGETLTLVDLVGNTLLSFTYGDGNTPAWPTTPDGDGTTLVLQRPFHSTTNPDLPADWRAGAAAGAPGTVDSTLFEGDPLLDRDGDGFSAVVEYGLGTSDTDPAELPLLTPTRDPDGRLVVTFRRPAAADDVTIEGLESPTLGDWTAADFQAESPAAPGWLLTTWRSTTGGNAMFMRLRVTWLAP